MRENLRHQCSTVRLSQEKWTRIISTTCEEDFVKEQEDVPEEGDVDIKNVVTGEIIPFSQVTHKVLNKKITGSKNKV